MLTVWKAAQMRVKKMKWQSQRKRNQAQRQQQKFAVNSDIVRKGMTQSQWPQWFW